MSSRLIILLTVLSFLFLYTNSKISQLLHFVTSSGILSAALTAAVFVLMIAWQFVYRARPEVFDRRWYQLLAWVGSFTMGLWATFIIISIPLDLAEGLVAGIGQMSHAAVTDPGAAGGVVNGSIRMALLATAALISGLGFVSVLRGPQVKTVSVPIDQLPTPLENLRIAQISDLHVGPLIRSDYVDEVVRRTNALEPDLVFLTGDFGDGKAVSIAPDLRPLGNLRARYGVFYVTGNHEYYWGAAAIIQEIQRLGIEPLLNANRVLTIDGARILVAGVTDPTGESFIADHRTDLARALATAESCDLKILLSHRPGLCHEAEAQGVDLQFSGHTHAGQFFPFSLFIPLAHKYFRGLNRHGKLWLYVNVGTGYWGPPNRFAVGSEITLLTCHRAHA